MRYHVLYNPHAGKGSTAESLAHVAGEYENAVLVDMTEIGDYAVFFANVDKDDAIVICGGDGTLNRFVNDTCELKIKNDVFYYANGTGNDFLKDVNPSGTQSVFKINKYIENLPTVEINGKVSKFINGIGYGIDGYCCEVGDALHAAGKKVNYTAIAIKGLLFKYKPTSARIIVDGVVHEFDKVWIAPTMNGKFYGGGMMPAPEQVRNSGELSLMVWHDSSKLSTLMAFPSLFKGEHLKHDKMITLYTGKEITVEFSAPRALQIDGETVLDVTSYTARAYSKAPVTV